MIELVEILITVTCVVSLLFVGVEIGRVFGSFENFVLFLLEKLKDRLENKK